MQEYVIMGNQERPELTRRWGTKFHVSFPLTREVYRFKSNLAEIVSFAVMIFLLNELC